MKKTNDLLLRKFINETISTNKLIKFDKEKEKEFLDHMKNFQTKDFHYEYVPDSIIQKKLTDINIDKRIKNNDRPSSAEIADIINKNNKLDVSAERQKYLKTFESTFSPELSNAQNKIIEKNNARFSNYENANFYFYHIPTEVSITDLILRTYNLNKKDYSDLYKSDDLNIQGDRANTYSNFKKSEYENPGNYFNYVTDQRITSINIKNLGGKKAIEKIIHNIKIYQLMYQESLQNEKDENFKNPSSSITRYEDISSSKNYFSKLKNAYTGIKLKLKNFYNDIKKNFIKTKKQIFFSK